MFSLWSQEILKQKDELFKKYKEELRLGDVKLSQTKKITNASEKVINAIIEENRARKLKVLEALREQAVTAKNITLAGQLTREIKKQREELNKPVGTSASVRGGIGIQSSNNYNVPDTGVVSQRTPRPNAEVAIQDQVATGQKFFLPVIFFHIDEFEALQGVVD